MQSKNHLYYLMLFCLICVFFSANTRAQFTARTHPKTNPKNGFSMVSNSGAVAKVTDINKESQMKREPKRWRISFALGSSSSGPAGDIEAAMLNSGFDGASPEYEGLKGAIVGWTQHPYSKTGFGEAGFPWSFTATYSIKNNLKGGLLLSHTPIGLTMGYDADSESFLELKHINWMVSPIIVFKGLELLNLGVGPALFINKIEQESGGETIYSENKIKLGAVIQGSLIYPENTLFFVKIDAQYRYAGQISFGEFSVDKGNEPHGLSPFEANFSHFNFGVGVGIHM